MVFPQIYSLADTEKLITETLSVDDAKDYMDENRIRAIVETARRRIENLQQLSIMQTSAQTDSTEDDVEEDIAEDYSAKK